MEHLEQPEPVVESPAVAVPEPAAPVPEVPDPIPPPEPSPVSRTVWRLP